MRRDLRTLALCVMGLQAFASAASANFPPVARGSASSVEPLVAEGIIFSAEASLDPDSGPEALSFDWDLGDGTTSTRETFEHAYASTGLKVVRLRVSDGLASTVTSFVVAVLDPPTATPARSSAPLALSNDERWLWVVNSDSGSVSRIDLESMVVSEASVCAEPASLVLTATRVLVSCTGDDSIASLDPVGIRVVERIRVGRAPQGLVALGDGRVLVTEEGDRTLRVLDASLEALRIVPLSGAPYAIAVDAEERRAFVTELRTSGAAANLMRVDLDTLEALPPIVLSEDPGPDSSTSGRGIPNVLRTVAIHPAGRSGWVGGIKQNTGRGLYVSGQAMDTRSRMRGVALPFDLRSAEEDVAQRLDTNDADSVSSIAFSPRGRYLYALHHGAGSLSIYDLPALAETSRGDGEAQAFDARIAVGDGPNGLVVDASGRRAFVSSALSREVLVVDLADARRPVIVSRVQVSDEPLAPEVAEGKRLFNRSGSPLHSDQSYIACASCHPGGSHDGRVWDFTQFGEGLRNTIDLRGRAGLAHGPLHWSANFDEVQDFENDIVTSFGGIGLAADGQPPHPPLGMELNAGRSAALDALAAYVTSLGSFPASPERTRDGSLSAEALRGRAIFFDAEARCVECHTPPRFTDSALREDHDYLLHDVGTLGDGSGQRLGGALAGLDTPTLLGVWATAPYLHDGSAPDLRAVLTTRNRDDRHGSTGRLSASELDDLIAYLRSLDGSADEVPRPPLGDAGVADSGADAGALADVTTSDAGELAAAGCSCRVGESAPVPRGLWILGLAWVLVRRLRRRSASRSLSAPLTSPKDI